jgi:hypothetical protein
VLDTAKLAVEVHEPVETDKPRLWRCCDMQIQAMYGVATEREVIQMREFQPHQWARLRYGMPIDGPLLVRILSQFGTKSEQSLEGELSMQLSEKEPLRPRPDPSPPK